jgi:hypothetical protein
MSKETKASEPSSESRWKSLLRTSGIFAILVGILWVAVTYMSNNLYRFNYPTTVIGFLQLFSQHQVLAASTWSTWIVADVLLIPVTIALYITLRGVNKSLAVGGAIFTLAFCIYDPLVSELQSLRLVGLSQTYMIAATETTKASVITNATSIVNALPMMTFLSFFVGSVGTLLFSIAMIKSNVFRRGTAVFGIITNMMAIIGAFSAIGVTSLIVELLFLFSVPAVALWLILTGGQLLRHFRQAPL